MTANFDYLPYPPGWQYRIQTGDTLEGLAQRFCVPIQVLIAANPHLNPSFLSLGELVYIPYQQNHQISGGSHCHYTVVTGDTFYRIACMHGISFDELRIANPCVDPDRLTPGQELHIPHKGGNPSTPFMPQCNTPYNCNKTGPVTYIVQEKDTLYSIACKFNTTETTLKNANPTINMNMLTPGQIIIISPPWKTYTNQAYNITFKFPSNWLKCDDYKYEGPDGFFQVLVTNGTIMIEDFCKQGGFNPCQGNPHYNQCQGQCVIYWPGGHAWANELGIFIVKYPKQITIAGQDYKYVILLAHKNFIQEIVKSFSFICG